MISHKFPEPGQRYGRLVLIGFVEKRLNSLGKWGQMQPFWSCICDCGRNITTNIWRVVYGRTKSCGCLKRESELNSKRTHCATVGAKWTPTYSSWASMKRRCLDNKYHRYDNYGGRGIKVCKRWKASFQNFLEDMGERPEGKTLDRKNNNGNYEPKNCKWSSTIEQNRNKRNNRLITFNGKTMTTIEWSEKIGINVETLRDRIDSGWTLEKALSCSVRGA